MFTFVHQCTPENPQYLKIMLYLKETSKTPGHTDDIIGDLFQLWFKNENSKHKY